MVRETANGLVCECPDNRFRKADCKHIKIVLDILKNNKCRKNNTFRIATLEKICNGFWIPENIRFTVNVDARVLQKV